MRILFTTFPGLGHFFPVVPLAWAARAAGHEVLFVTTGPALAACGQAGMPAIEAAPGFDMHGMMRERLAAAGPDSSLFRDALSDAARPHVARMMSGISDRLSDAVVETARSWHPDLIVHTPIDASGPLAGALLGVPTVLHGIGLSEVGGRALAELIYEAMRPTCERHGLTSGPAWPAAALDCCPPSMRGPDRAPARSLRCVPYNGGGVVPEWLRRPPSRQRICLTLGSAVPHLWGVSGLRGVVEAVSELSVEVVLALGDTDISELGPLPDGVQVTGWVPLSVLAPTCTVIVHHGGAGTTTNALVAGTLQLVLPHGADQHQNAEAVARRGVGLTLAPEAADAATVRRSLDRLLLEPAFLAACEEVRDEMATQPSPAEVVSQLAGLR